MSAELKPCPNPWCDSHDMDMPLTSIGTAEAAISFGRIGFRMRCFKCRLSGPIKETKPDAWAAWNTRAPEPLLAEVREVWRPIKTAPKDGSVIHVISTKWFVPVPAYYISKEYLDREYGDPEWMEEGWYPSGLFLFDLPEQTMEPTHWTPLHPAPRLDAARE